ncbi:MAG: hypothetical protein HYU78_12800 [Rhodocyclales bacterium]|nr:hypothetical protein [Rhodocyclales bacterium]
MKYFAFATEVIYCIAVHAILVVFVGLWWNTAVLSGDGNLESRLFRAIAFVAVFALFAVDSYRRQYRRGRKFLFFASSLSPLVVSLVGFFYGLCITWVS